MTLDFAARSCSTMHRSLWDTAPIASIVTKNKDVHGPQCHQSTANSGMMTLDFATREVVSTLCRSLWDTSPIMSIVTKIKMRMSINGINLSLI